jgi:tetratricopeptide (TPR) repeat protein
VPSRIEDLERRVRQDPSSIAFGALAEEYRRGGRLEDAVATCRSGLERHPSYLSARVTLGRALQELGRVADARGEFTYVLSIAPDNLAAIRGLAELHGGDGDSAVAQAEAAPPPAAPLRSSHPAPARAHDPDLAALDASFERVDPASAAGAEREAQIERLEIWLARIEQARES